MQIAPSSLVLVPPSTGTPIGPDKGGKAAQDTPGEPLASRAKSSAPVESASNATESVSLSAEVKTRAANNTPAPVYAEIWKSGLKVAEVDIYGHVFSYSGVVAAGGGGMAGPLLAAQRAVQVAAQSGGEIRTAGQPLDSQTLLMRARLAKAYAS